MSLIRQITTQEQPLLDGLCALLTDSVDHGASVGFLSPLPQPTAARYWQRVLRSLGPGLALWVAEQDGRIIGSVQLALCEKDNGRHRAEVQKLFVLSSHRGRGVANKLMSALERFARASGRTLLVLDTQLGSVAETVYQRLAWQRAGEIPDYAATPEGVLHPTVYYYKAI